MYKNSYPRDFVDKYIKEFLNRVLTRKVVVSTVPKKDLMIVLPYSREIIQANTFDSNANIIFLLSSFYLPLSQMPLSSEMLVAKAT